MYDPTGTVLKSAGTAFLLVWKLRGNQKQDSIVGKGPLKDEGIITSIYIKVLICSGTIYLRIILYVHISQNIQEHCLL
jgi:hypothetical protein